MGKIWENIEDAEIDGEAAIREALETFEPRITVLDIEAEANSNTGLILFTITFEINNTDEKISLIFPFRVGTELSFA
jgi:predicted component of type VI protein secretion system